VIRYIAENPVKEGLARSPFEYSGFFVLDEFRGQLEATFRSDAQGYIDAVGLRGDSE
jgi:hypothetical protein